MLMCFVQSQTLEGGFGKKSFKGGLNVPRALRRAIPK